MNTVTNPNTAPPPAPKPLTLACLRVDAMVRRLSYWSDIMALTNTQYAETIAAVGGYYNFVTLVMRRMKELHNGKAPMVEPQTNEDEVDMIVREIDSGFLEISIADSE